MPHLPAHLPRRISSWQFPHRNADAYLRDATLDGTDFVKTDLGRAIFAATPWDAGSGQIRDSRVELGRRAGRDLGDPWIL